MCILLLECGTWKDVGASEFDFGAMLSERASSFNWSSRFSELRLAAHALRFAARVFIVICSWFFGGREAIAHIVDAYEDQRAPALVPH